MKMDGIKIKTESIVHPIDVPETINVVTPFGNMEYVKPEDMPPGVLLELCDRFTMDLFKTAGKEIPTRIVDGGAEQNPEILVTCQDESCIYQDDYRCTHVNSQMARTGEHYILQLNSIGKCITKRKNR